MPPLLFCWKLDGQHVYCMTRVSSTLMSSAPPRECPCTEYQGMIYRYIYRDAKCNTQLIRIDGLAQMSTLLIMHHTSTIRLVFGNWRKTTGPVKGRLALDRPLNIISPSISHQVEVMQHHDQHLQQQQAGARLSHLSNTSSGFCARRSGLIFLV